jgi:23S rRNA pseudouridine2605 synthase
MLKPLERGIVIDGERFRPMSITIDRVQGANCWLTMGIKEGKNREIRRALGEIGLDVNRLIRVSYGPFQLGELKDGAVEEIRGKIMRDQLGIKAEPQAVQRARRASPASDPSRSLRKRR